jgi:hypothetical protein
VKVETAVKHHHTIQVQCGVVLCGHNAGTESQHDCHIWAYLSWTTRLRTKEWRLGLVWNAYDLVAYCKISLALGLLRIREKES